MDFAERMAGMATEAGDLYSPLHRYTVIALETQGLDTPEAIAVFTAYGKAVQADSTYSAVAGEASGRGWLIATPLDAFEFARRLEGQKVRKLKVCFHGYLHDYFTNRRGTPDEVERVARCANTIKRFRSRYNLED